MSKSIALSELPSLVGTEMFLSDWTTIRQRDLDMFRLSTLMDEQYVDLSIAKSNPLGNGLVDGFMLISMLSYFHFKYCPIRQDGMFGINYGFESVRFLSPVMADEKVRCRGVLSDVRIHTLGARVTFKTEIDIENKERPAMVCDWVILYSTQSPSAH